MRRQLRQVTLGVVAGLSAGLALSACGLYQSCRQDADCGEPVLVCLPTHLCAPKCRFDRDCGLADTFCSASGGCLRRGTCGVDADCHAGQRCTGRGVCASPDAGSSAPSCGGERFEADPVQANMLLVLDHSGSMTETIGGTSKWDSAVRAVQQLTSRFQGPIRFGLAMFSSPAVCDPGGIVVNVGDGTAAQIVASLPIDADGNGTPIAEALARAAQEPALADATRADYVLLITDGMENCGGDPVARVRTLFSRGVRTYAVGFGAEVDAARLSELAVQGGTARLGATRYYQADDSTSLEQALSSIGQGAMGCDFTLRLSPPDPSRISVAVDGLFMPHDPTRHSGWTYTAASNRITLYGLACDAVATRPGAKVSVVYGCPDPTLVEVGPGGRLTDDDGGVRYDLDAGQIT